MQELYLCFKFDLHHISIDYCPLILRWMRHISNDVMLAYLPLHNSQYDFQLIGYSTYALLVLPTYRFHTLR